MVAATHLVPDPRWVPWRGGDLYKYVCARVGARGRLGGGVLSAFQFINIFISHRYINYLKI